MEEQGRFLDALLDPVDGFLLDRGLTVEELRQSLGEDAAFAPFRGYVGAFEPRMLAVAAELVKKWGRRSDE